MIAVFSGVLTQVVILLILIAFGFILAKKNILTQNGVKDITELVLYFVTPCVIIKSFIRKFDSKMLKGLLLSFLIVVLLHILFILISKAVIRPKDIQLKRALQFGVIFSNCGYMSLPLQEALLGETGVFYGASFIAIFNLFVWSYGILLMSGDKKYLSAKKLIINPGIIGLAAGLVIFLFSIPVPKVISEPISYIAGLNTPLPMIIIGFHLAKSDIKKAVKNIHCVTAVILRLVAAPLMSIGLMYVCGVRGTLFSAIAIASCAPCAAIGTMFASKFGGDAETSASLVSLSTALSLVTMPFIITLAGVIA